MVIIHFLRATNCSFGIKEDREDEGKKEAHGAKDAVHRRNKPFFLRQTPNQSKLACIHGLIRENTRSLSSLWSRVTITLGTCTRPVAAANRLFTAFLFTGHSLFLLVKEEFANVERSSPLPPSSLTSRERKLFSSLSWARSSRTSHDAINSRLSLSCKRNVN